MNYEFEFKGRKPSKAQVMNKIGEMFASGDVSNIVIQWGENWMQFTQQSNGLWCGFGHIKNISADDIAKELNDIRKEAQKFIKEHFQFIHIK